MNIWENTVLTDQGKALQAKLIKGETLKIRRVTTGAGKVPVVDLRQQTSVTNGGYDIILQPARTDGTHTILPVLLENKGLKESYDLCQVGFYADDPEEGEILFCLSQASQTKHIPSEAESPGFSITWDFYFNTSNTAPFEVVLNSAGSVNIEAFQVHTDEIQQMNSTINSINSALEMANTEIGKKANQTDLSGHTGNKNNPHSITKAQIGLDRVQNSTIKIGYVTITGVPANSYKDVTVNHGCSAQPLALANFSTSSTSADYGNMSVTCHSINSTTMTIRAWNKSSGTKDPTVTWIAIV